MLAIIRYERLPTFCYGCGRIGHTERSCERHEASIDNRYGFWLLMDFIQSRCIWQSNLAGDSQTTAPTPEIGEHDIEQSNRDIFSDDRNEGGQE